MSDTLVETSAAEVLTAGSPRLEALLDTIAEGAAERDRERIHPYDIFDLIRQTRLGALRIRREDGGGGASYRDLYDTVIRLGAADSNVAHSLRNHYVFAERYARNPRDAREREWQRAVVAGKIVGLANGELDSKKVGGRVYATTLTRDGDGYRLSGTKYYSTGTLYSDLVLIRAVGPDGSSASVIIPVDREGVELVDDWDGAGQRLTGTGTTILKDVRVEEDEVVYDAPGVGYGVVYASTLPQLFLTAVNAGILQALAQDAAALVRERSRTFHHAAAETPAQDPLLQQTVGQIASAAFAAETLVLAAADELDRLDAANAAGKDTEELALQASLRAAKAKVVIDELAIRAGGQIFDVGGASATKRSRNLDRHWRNARTLASHNPASYKAAAIGNYHINGEPLPKLGFF
ncbi:acyl-CoA dehydrogenase family protein [Pseudochelatococcus contaminans]|uniref:Alkylation response protein AidB-like acyl-CoA dehydrogenase n=1 Tax=Pseudochelatococcus contaminans TaxID=1538103 RepID=A0A7W5Z682_9HYPH|nr:acyl-CoA dehydrogenase family protein [Pseudochelatococcus contaminans]MBB3810459.1 alkylation response protein AidB-like acyl-CoA dehydrogenase [Pseudochelatococcus contaminans]